MIPSLCRNFEIEDSQQQQHTDEERKEVSQAARQIYTSTIYSTSGLFGLGAWGWYYLTTTSTSTSTSTTTVSRFTGQAEHILRHFYMYSRLLNIEYKHKLNVYIRLMHHQFCVTGGYTGKAKSCIGAWVPQYRFIAR